MPRKLSTLIALLLVLGFGAVLFVRLRSEPAAESRRTAPASPTTIAASGEILGVAIGSAIEEARKKLDPLQVPRTDAPDQKEKLGRRIYWKLNGTEYDWIMVWANAEGKVTRVRALFRPEHQRPFTEIGDVSQALTADTAIVRWNLLRPDGSPYRLTAQGAEGRAVSVYMFSQEVPSREQQHDAEPDLEEKSQLE